MSKNTLVVNIFGKSKNCVYVAQYIKENLERLKFDVQHFFSCPMDSKTFSKNDKNVAYMYYDHALEWLLDYDGLVDVIVNESPIAKYAYIGNKCFDDVQKNVILKNAAEFDNFNIMILERDSWAEGDEEDKLMSFLTENNISCLTVSKNTVHLDQIVKDIEDRLLPSMDIDYLAGTDTETNT